MCFVKAQIVRAKLFQATAVFMNSMQTLQSWKMLAKGARGTRKAVSPVEVTSVYSQVVLLKAVLHANNFKTTAHAPVYATFFNSGNECLKIRSLAKKKKKMYGHVVKCRQYLILI